MLHEPSYRDIITEKQNVNLRDKKKIRVKTDRLARVLIGKDYCVDIDYLMVMPPLWLDVTLDALIGFRLAYFLSVPICTLYEDVC